MMRIMLETLTAGILSTGPFTRPRLCRRGRRESARLNGSLLKVGRIVKDEGKAHRFWSVTDPITYLQKKKRVQRRAYACLFPGGACESVDYLLQGRWSKRISRICPCQFSIDFQDRRWKKVKGKTNKQMGIRTWDATFVITSSQSLEKLQASNPQSYEALFYGREGATYLNVLSGTAPLTGNAKVN